MVSAQRVRLRHCHDSLALPRDGAREEGGGERVKMDEEQGRAGRCRGGPLGTDGLQTRLPACLPSQHTNMRPSSPLLLPSQPPPRIWPHTITIDWWHGMLWPATHRVARALFLLMPCGDFRLMPCSRPMTVMAAASCSPPPSCSCFTWHALSRLLGRARDGDWQG